MAITELDNIYMGEEGKSLYLEASVPHPAPQHTHIHVKCVHSGSWNICFSLLFLFAAFQLDFLAQVPGLSLRPGSVNHRHRSRIKEGVQG